MHTQFERLNKAMARALGISPEELIKSFAPANISDIDAICELRQEGFGPHLRNDKNKMLWRYFSRNPKRSDILVLKLKNKIVAAVGVEPISVALGGVIHPGVRCADIVVEAALMGKGLGAWMNLYVQNAHSIVTAMGSNKNSNSMVNKLFTPINIRQYLKYPIKSSSYLMRKKSSFWSMARLHKILDIGLYFRRKLHSQLSKVNGYSVQLLEDFASIKNFASINNGLTAHNIVVRDAEFIQWRYIDNPVSHFVPFGIFNQKTLVGYAILKRNDTNHSADEWYLMDWQIHPTQNKKTVLRYLMVQCVEYAAAMGASFVTTLLSDSLSKAAAVDGGFILRYIDAGFYLWANDAISKDIFSETNWFLTFADTDEVT